MSETEVKKSDLDVVEEDALAAKTNQDENGNEISSIKVDIDELAARGAKVKKVPRFSYSTAEYDSYKANGFSPPDAFSRPDKQEQRFLGRVDLSKTPSGKIKVRIVNMIRTRAIDYSSEKQERKEYLTYLTEWSANDFLGNEIHCRSHQEGFYKELTRTLVTKIDRETGQTYGYYVRGPMRDRFTIPFNKKTVDKILNDPHPFGEDSINISSIENIAYYGKFQGERGIQSMRTGDYSYDQFILPEWNHFMELALRKGGPAARIPNAEQKEAYIK